MTYFLRPHYEEREEKERSQQKWLYVFLFQSFSVGQKAFLKFIHPRILGSQDPRHEFDIWPHYPREAVQRCCFYLIRSKRLQKKEGNIWHEQRKSLVHICKLRQRIIGRLLSADLRDNTPSLNRCTLPVTRCRKHILLVYNTKYP